MSVSLKQSRRHVQVQLHLLLRHHCLVLHGAHLMSEFVRYRLEFLHYDATSSDVLKQPEQVCTKPEAFMCASRDFLRLFAEARDTCLGEARLPPTAAAGYMHVQTNPRSRALGRTLVSISKLLQMNILALI